MILQFNLKKLHVKIPTYSQNLISQIHQIANIQHIISFHHSLIHHLKKTTINTRIYWPKYFFLYSFTICFSLKFFIVLILFSCVNNAASYQHECKRCYYCLQITNNNKRRLWSEIHCFNRILSINSFTFQFIIIIFVYLSILWCGNSWMKRMYA